MLLEENIILLMSVIKITITYKKLRLAWWRTDCSSAYSADIPYEHHFVSQLLLSDQFPAYGPGEQWTMAQLFGH